jgi:hypothetical protein
MVSAITASLMAMTLSASAAVAQATTWNCTQSIDGFVPLRLDDAGDVQCWSNDGKTCVLSWNEEGCTALVNNPDTTPPLNPLSCGCMHKAAHSGGGYSQWGDNYWCAAGKTALHANPANPDCNQLSGWKCTNYYGFQTPVRLDDNGDVQCWSDTAEDCKRFDTDDECAAFVQTTTTSPAAPWSCGCKHLAVEMNDGYTDKGDAY